MDTNKTKHTPGPWHIGLRQPSSDKFIYGSNGGEVADCNMESNFPEENLANARLIAAAPELLEALRDALGSLIEARDEHDFNSACTIKIAQDAIAKAEGE